ncbi:DUF3846 domain-containing protein [Ruminococcaceae bacterium OttesenSCG-928-D13]|nr:DUF3846 domain-containing protein [Ruminococcaceae bacterium OttesenSCG-928-D13]
MAEKIDVLIVSPCSVPRVAQIENTLDAKQFAVGGYIEVIHPFADRDVAVVVNEEGKLLGLEPNRAIQYPNGIKDIIVGSFIICRDAGEDFASLTPQQMSYYAEMFKSPEILVNIAGDYQMMSPYDIGEKTYRIYQLKPGDEYRGLRFTGLDGLKGAGQNIDPQNYRFVYSGALHGRNLEELYQQFNLEHPSDFRGHSLSVSDVVVISDGKSETAYFCDSMGFAKLDGFTTPESLPTPPAPKKSKPPKKKGGDAR